MPGAEQPIGGLDVLSLLGPMARGQFVGQNWDQLKGIAQGSVDLQAQQQEAQKAALAQALSQAAMAKDAGDAFKADPSDANLARYAGFNPKWFETFKAAHDLKNEDQQRQDLRDWSAMRGMLQSGDWDGAAAHIQRRIDADSKAGLPTQDDQHALDLVRAKSPAALAYTNAAVYAALGKERYNEAYGADAKNASELATAAKTTAETKEIAPDAASKRALEAAQAAEAGVKTVGADQSLVKIGPGGVGGNSPSGSYAALLDNLIGSEKGDTPDAKNPRSSAAGDGQFIDSTWLQVVKDHRPELAAGKSDKQILAMRSDQKLSRELVGDYAQDNAQVLAASGAPVTAASLAMAHKLGPVAALKVMGANPDARMADVVGEFAASKNPQFAKLNVRQYADGLVKQFGTGNVDFSGKDGGGASGGAQVLFQGGNVAATQAMNDAANSGLTGNDFLKTLPNAQQKMVQALAEGRMDFPNGNAMKSQYWQNMLSAVGQYDPAFDTVNSHARAAVRKDFTAGQSAKNIKSLNTAIGHMGELDEAIDGLGNYSFPLNNAIAHGIAKATGTDKRLAKFEAAKVAVANELTQVFRGAGGAEADVQGWLKQLKAASNPATLHETVRTMVDLLNSRVDAIGDSYNKGMGTTADPLTLLNPKAAATLGRLSGKTNTFALANGSKAIVVERR